MAKGASLSLPNITYYLTCLYLSPKGASILSCFHPTHRGEHNRGLLQNKTIQRWRALSQISFYIWDTYNVLCIMYVILADLSWFLGKPNCQDIGSLLINLGQMAWPKEIWKRQSANHRQNWLQWYFGKLLTFDLVPSRYLYHRILYSGIFRISNGQATYQ